MLNCPYCLRDKYIKYEMSCEHHKDDEHGEYWTYQCAICNYSEIHAYRIKQDGDE